ncbi:MAG: hypothetical protein CL875_02105 [Dehalococcoidales bacterium]|nr:hypothetical protein [Dehalococcoidales bacterium]
MNTSWQPKPGDRVFRPRLIKRHRLRRVLGVPAVFSAGYGNVGRTLTNREGLSKIEQLEVGYKVNQKER